VESGVGFDAFRKIATSIDYKTELMWLVFESRVVTTPHITITTLRNKQWPVFKGGCTTISTITMTPSPPPQIRAACEGV